MRATHGRWMETASGGSNTSDNRNNKIEEVNGCKNLGIMHKYKGTVSKREDKRDQIILYIGINYSQYNANF